ncbi:zinc ABC transporter substrate-binding protein [Ruegeria atlantica]|uniref:High-affinity zinc uptake system protein ZnuA n=1 Tax=Ruegeria atlantica TaxID=81569 RepID=A0A0P1E2H0_9RHOB|nr:zinc ABC transporter substrate-binding protein [Ruegeria atlantica]CUH41926.1 High-affinity zinc uptake system protein ZnuA precursor [Ruegeria atlantica]
MSRKLLPVSITAALMGGTAMADAPSVAVDIAPVHSLVARVMEGVGTPNLIVQPGASPHEYNLRPSEADALQNADLVFWIGEDLTPWMEGAVETLADGATVTTLLEADGTVLLDFREGALFEAHDHGDDEHAEDKEHDDHGHGDDHAEGDDHDDHDHEDHADEKDHDDHDHSDEHAEDKDHDDHDHGDEHAEGEDHDDHDDEHAGHDDHHDHAHGDHDPHAWLSPENANTWLNVIAAQLSAADPDNAGAYFANAAAAREEMAALAAEVNETLEPVRGVNFIVFHDAYQYFENAFDFPASGAISIGDASDPSPARIAEIQGRISEEDVNCVLSEPQFNPGLVATVLDGTEATTAVIDPLGSDLEPGAELYPQMIRNIAKTLAECL